MTCAVRGESGALWCATAAPSRGTPTRLARLHIVRVVLRLEGALVDVELGAHALRSLGQDLLRSRALVCKQTPWTRERRVPKEVPPFVSHFKLVYIRAMQAQSNTPDECSKGRSGVLLEGGSLTLQEPDFIFKIRKQEQVLYKGSLFPGAGVWGHRPTGSSLGSGSAGVGGRSPLPLDPPL